MVTTKYINHPKTKKIPSFLVCCEKVWQHLPTRQRQPVIEKKNEPQMSIKFELYSRGRQYERENLDMIPVICRLWDRNGVIVVTQIFNVQIQWVSGQDHKPVTARTQDHGTVYDEVRNHLSRDYKHQKNLSAYKSGHQSMCLSLATTVLTYWSWAWRTILTVIPCKAFSFSSVQASLSTIWSCITR